MYLEEMAAVALSTVAATFLVRFVYLPQMQQYGYTQHGNVGNINTPGVFEMLIPVEKG